MLRAASVSSIRSRYQSPKSRLATALNALPTWSDPVGLGAKRTLFMPASLEVEGVTNVERVRRERNHPRVAVLPPAAPLVEAPGSRVLLEHPEPARRRPQRAHDLER